MKDPLISSSLTPSSFPPEPLELLIELVRKQERDIFQIEIHSITRQYIKSLRKNKGRDLEEVGNFIRMASWLVYIKSKKLFPKKELEEGPELSELKNKLSQRMAICQKYQMAGGLLYNRALLGRDCWKSPQSLNLKPEKDTKIEVEGEMALFKLSEAYHQIRNRKSRRSYRIPKAFPSLLSHIRRMASVLLTGARLSLSQLLRGGGEKRQSQLLSFLSILELSKAGFISLFQKKPFSKIEILVKKTITKVGIKSLSLGEGPQGKS